MAQDAGQGTPIKSNKKIHSVKTELQFRGKVGPVLQRGRCGTIVAGNEIEGPISEHRVCRQK